MGVMGWNVKQLQFPQPETHMHMHTQTRMCGGRKQGMNVECLTAPLFASGVFFLQNTLTLA